MTIQFLGAVGEVTGSCYYLEHGNHRFLVDCGMFQGESETEEKNARHWPFDPASLDFVILTHAHFDHCGRLPKLYHDGFRGRIYTTNSTAELAFFILADAANVMFHNAREYHDQPLYSLNEVKALNSLYYPLPYDQTFTLGPDLNITLHDAGHILGSAMIELKLSDQTVVFSGDLGNSPAPLLNPPAIINKADAVVMETTYGDRIHQSVDRAAALQQIVLETMAKRGTLLIPAFALERTQEILYHLDTMREKKIIPDLPIFVDSPLAIEVTGVFRRHEADFDQQSRQQLKSGDDFFSFPHLRYCTTAEESKAIQYVPSPKIIIAGSGMINGGRILHHLLQYGQYRQTIICIVGYQVPGTLGRRLLDGERQVKVMHQSLTVQAEVINISAFSAHADQVQLLKWVKHFQQLPKLFLTHGEDPARQAIGQLVTKQQSSPEVIYPTIDQVYSL